MKRPTWLKMRKKTDPELPYEPPMWFGARSNGEAWLPATKRDRLLRKAILEKSAENARKLGMDRRDFLASAMGMATVGWVINACSDAESGDKGNPSTTDGGAGGGSGADSGKDARMCVPTEAMYSEECATGIVSGDEFIFDVQTHWFQAEDLEKFPAYKDAFGALFAIATEDAYINQIFCNSDTTMVCLTAWPGITCTSTRRIGCGFPLSNANMAASRDRINQIAGNTQRVLSHVQILPQDPSGIEEQLRIMEEYACIEKKISAWKLYPGFKPGFRLDDATAEAVIEKGLELGVNRFCIHKGLPIGNFFDVTTNYPDDVGPAAVKYPDAKFIIYHSAIHAGSETATVPEGPYDPDEPNPKGVNALIRSVLENGLGPGSNVYGETGTSFNTLKSNPEAAAHFFGKLMKYLGEDNVCWGTDSIINGTPQNQIEPFRMLEIPQTMQDQYGYPPLDAERKAKILGKNSAAAYGIDIDAVRCEMNTCPMAEIKKRLDDELGARRWTFDPPGGPKTFEKYLEGCDEMRRTGRPG